MSAISLQSRAITSTIFEVFKAFRFFKAPTALIHDPAAESFISGWDSHFFNNIVLRHPASPEKLIPEIRDFHSSLKKPLLVWTTPETDYTEAPLLSDQLKQNFGYHGAFTGMLLELNKAKIPPVSVPGMAIKEVQTEKDALSFSRVLCDIFQMNSIEPVMAIWAIQQAQLSLPVARNYVATIDDVPVAVASLFMNTAMKTGGLYNAGVLPSHRKLGIGSALAKHRVEVAKSMGLDSLSIILMSDGMARGYCERMGFETHSELTPYFVG